MAFNPFNTAQMQTLERLHFEFEHCNYYRYKTVSLESSISFYKGTYNVDYYSIKSFGLKLFQTFDEALRFIAELQK